MSTGTRSIRRRLISRQYRSTPYPLSSRRWEVLDKDLNQKKNFSKALEKEDWLGATCSVCLEYPHNAVLLLCSSHDKGCRPYMCSTSCRHSNCLDQFEKAHTKVSSDAPIDKFNGTELTCPLCRGQVKGWTVVEAAREYLNAKKRCCMQDKCTFAGTYKELRKHVKRDHPLARTREVDPTLEDKWRRLVHERERDDVISTLRSSMPGAMVVGDYVIERNDNDFDSDDEDGEGEEGNENGNYERSLDDSNIWNFLFLVQAFGSAGNGLRRNERGSHHRLANGEGPPVLTDGIAVSSEGENDDGDSLSSHQRDRVMRLERSIRRRRHSRPS
ncbi:hypothetical protein GIB67_003017 [Kingdonia uniflora]|uniref:Uncharacterized protein n=1 Tax=Kingdonia uniflora TaxID=39325 RepID=A0A7J7LYG4_9MAGN|nr:hypothetical protein GIB67_003017 [Kingdonia uniflora]